MSTSLQEAFVNAGLSPATFFASTAKVAAKPQAKPTPLRVAKAEQKPAPQATKTAVAEEQKPAIISRFSAEEAAKIVALRASGNRPARTKQSTKPFAEAPHRKFKALILGEGRQGHWVKDENTGRICWQPLGGLPKVIILAQFMPRMTTYAMSTAVRPYPYEGEYQLSDGTRELTTYQAWLSECESAERKEAAEIEPDEEHELLAGPRHPYSFAVAGERGRHIKPLGNIDEACGAMASGQPGHSLYACVI